MENIVAEVNAYSNINRTQAINIPDIYEQFTIKNGVAQAVGYFNATKGYFR